MHWTSMWAAVVLMVVVGVRGGKWKSIEHYAAANNYTFSPTTWYRDYGAKTLQRVRFIHLPKTGTTFAATVVHYGCDKTDNVYIDVMVKLNSMVPFPWKLDKTCQERILVAKSRNGNWWTHAPFREQDAGYAGMP